MSLFCCCCFFLSPSPYAKYNTEPYVNDNAMDQWLSRWDSWTSSISITWTFVKNSNSQVLSQMQKLCADGSPPSVLILIASLADSDDAEVWEPYPRCGKPKYDTLGMTNLDSELKSRDITLWIKVHIVKAMVYPVVIYGCKSWAIKKVEHWSTDAFKLWCWRRLESPLDCKEIKPVNPKENQLWIFIGRTDAEIDTPILWLPDAKNQLTGKDSDVGKQRGQERRGWQKLRCLDGMIDSMDMSLSKFQEAMRDRGAWYATVLGVTKSDTI